MKHTHTMSTSPHKTILLVEADGEQKVVGAATDTPPFDTDTKRKNPTPRKPW